MLTLQDFGFEISGTPEISIPIYRQTKLSEFSELFSSPNWVTLKEFWGEIMTIEEINLVGTILIGLGLMLQGWFILDLNKRITLLMSKIWLETEVQEWVKEEHTCSAES